jgi:cytochrome c553
MNRILVASVVICSYLGSGQVGHAGSPPAFSELIAHCESCHGPNGNSATASIPRLNGQPSDYLLLRLKEFDNPTSQTTHAFDNMWPVVTAMSDDTKRQIADYFAQQSLPKVTLAGPLTGKKLYEQGVAGFASCQNCHGPAAEGSVTAPRLAGQQLEYLKTQLWSFNFVTRVHGPMNAGAMKMMSGDIDALATYLAGK